MSCDVKKSGDQDRTLINADLDKRAVVHSTAEKWVNSPMAGVKRKMFERNGNEVARATTMVQFAPKSFFSAHSHSGGEEFVVLDGVFSDEHGDFGPGTYIRNPIDTSHTPFSEPGCTIFVKLWQMHPGDVESVTIDMDKARWQEGGSAGIKYLPLYESDTEIVMSERWAAGTKLGTVRSLGGLEYFVLEGQFEDENGTYEKHSWLRLPPGMTHTPKTTRGCTLFVKAGHLENPPALPE